MFAVSYRDRKSNLKKWHLVSRGEQPKCITGEIRQPDATIIVPYHQKTRKLVVIREFRVPVGGYQYGFPAGLLDPGESLFEAAKRELFEETGLNLVSIHHHSPAIFSSAGITDESISMIFAEVEGQPSTQHLSDSEDIEIFMMNRDEVATLLTRTDIVFGARAWLVMDAYVLGGADYIFHSDKNNFPKM